MTTTSAAALALAATLAAACATRPGARAPNEPPNAPSAAGPAAACTFTNPVLRGADPSVVRHGGIYYFAQSRADGSIVVSRSARLTGLGANPVRVWAPADTGWNRANVWAPELLEFDGRWYLYYAASARPGSPFTGQRTGVLRSRTADPQGAWEDLGPIYTGDGPAAGPGAEHVWAIDMTVGRIGGRLYAVWSGWERNAPTDKTVQHLYIMRLTNPYTPASPRVRLSSPTAPWERGPELPLQEGPEFLERGGRTFVVYSTNDSWLPTYQLGMLALTPGRDPLDPASWVKTGPVFAPANGVVGVGHHTFTQSPDGREDWLVYHAKTSASPGWDRVIRMQRFTWRADGTPDFGAPVATGAPVPAPSGECR